MEERLKPWEQRIVEEEKKLTPEELKKREENLEWALKFMKNYENKNK